METMSAASLSSFHQSFTSPIVEDITSPQPFLKMEDLHSSSPPALDDSTPLAFLQNSPPPVIVHSKPAKKRKSWGQELPEPKTNLPPRKRAKTDDEKEQRRIERIKRNRAAAHNSRERKRQETEILAVALARANAELDAYRTLHGPLPASVVLPEVTISTEPDTPAPSLIQSPDTPAPSLIESHGSPDDPASPRSPSIHHDVGIKQEVGDSTALSTLPVFTLPVFSLDDKPSMPFSGLDLTQHSAVSVEPSELRHGLSQRSMVDTTLSLPHDASASDLYSDNADCHLESFAFTDGALDGSFNPPLDFSFDDFINDAATVAVDGIGAA